jgi:hypothetical protein
VRNFCLAASLLLVILALALRASAASDGIPEVIRIPASVGDVTFQHAKHVKERGIACNQCHHQINARKLNTPHPDYLGSSWINCRICHDDSGAVKQIYTCSACHPATPVNVADETLSAKVVIHRQCWQCHQAGTGKDATTACAKCHAGGVAAVRGGPQ